MIADPNFTYLAAAYALAFVVVGFMVVQITAEHSALKRALVRVEKKRPDQRR